MDEVKALFSLFQDLFVEYTELDGFKSGSIDWEHEILCKSDISSEIKAYASQRGGGTRICPRSNR
jgi:hypothetical protein